MSLIEAQGLAKEPGGALSIAHIIDNQDGTFSVMRHINCEFCDYCGERNAWYDAGVPLEEIDARAHIAKSDPYEEQKKRFPENYGLAPSSMQ